MRCDLRYTRVDKDILVIIVVVISRGDLSICYFALPVILCQVLLEPYARAYYFGSERVSKRYGTEPEQDGCTYKDIKALCEQPYSGQ